MERTLGARTIIHYGDARRRSNGNDLQVRSFSVKFRETLNSFGYIIFELQLCVRSARELVYFNLPQQCLTPEGNQEEYYGAVEISAWFDPDVGPLLCESSS